MNHQPHHHNSPKPRLNHKEMYKSTLRTSNHIHHLRASEPLFSDESQSANDCTGNNNSPSWRDVYKKRCFDEFKKSRQKLVNRFRNFNLSSNDDSKTPTKFKDYLQEELEKICLLEAKTNPNLITIDEAAEIYKQIQSELLPQYDIDPNQLDEYLRSLEVEERLFEESIVHSNNNFNQVICPVCQKSNLIQQNFIIKCNNNISNGCNFKLDINQTGIDLNQLEKRLEFAMRQHEQCNEIPQFQFKSAQSMDRNEFIVLSQLSTLPSASCFLIMTCDKCQLMHMVI